MPIKKNSIIGQSFIDNNLALNHMLDANHFEMYEL